MMIQQHEAENDESDTLALCRSNLDACFRKQRHFNAHKAGTRLLRKEQEGWTRDVFRSDSSVHRGNADCNQGETADEETSAICSDVDITSAGPWADVMHSSS